MYEETKGVIKNIKMFKPNVSTKDPEVTKYHSQRYTTKNREEPSISHYHDASGLKDLSHISLKTVVKLMGV